ncbi:MAG TPA: transposase [Clostridia bacterium]|nr:transposase [Clostridia bacterium]
MQDLKPYYRRNLPHIHAGRRFQFATFCTYNRWILPECVRGLVLQSCQHEHDRRAFISAVVVMPDHVHLIFAPMLDEAKNRIWHLSEILGGIKSASAHAVNKELRRSGPVWQEETFDHVLRSGENLNEKLVYVVNNPVRRGIVKHPRDYPWLWTADPEFLSRI